METGLKFDRQGLLPAVIVDDDSGEVLMVAFMNQEALRLTLETRQTHFFSRSRGAIWHKGEQSGNTQDVRALFVNCEENSLLLRVVQQGGAACHEGYRSCYYRQLMPDGNYTTIAERIFDPKQVYGATHDEPPDEAAMLEKNLRMLYGVYLYLRDNDLSEQSNTSRLLQERSQSYLVSRLADELQELAEVQTGEHIHTNRQADTTLEGSQVGYWLFLLGSTCNILYNDFMPHIALLSGHANTYSEGKAIEERQECLELVASSDPEEIARGLHLGFAQVGWACSEAGISPAAPTEFDLAQMRRKGLVK